MKILVTGGAGFIGTHVVNKLLKEKCEVVIVDNLSTGLLSNVHPSARFIQMDIRSNELLNLFNSEKIDYVIHLAAQTMVHKSLEEPRYDCDINIVGTLNVLECCRLTKVKRIIFASTAAVYGNVTTLPVLEAIEKSPTSFYGLSKLSCENYMKLYSEVFGLEYIALRYANVYGEGQGDAGEGGVVSIFTRKIFQDHPIVIYGDGSQTRDFIYVGDIANANYCALLSNNPNAVYNISTQTEISIHTLIDYLEKASNKTVKKVYNPPREGDIYRSILSNSEAQKNMAWQPGVSLPEGLTRTYKFFLSQKLKME